MEMPELFPSIEIRESPTAKQIFPESILLDFSGLRRLVGQNSREEQISHFEMLQMEVSAKYGMLRAMLGVTMQDGSLSHE